MISFILTILILTSEVFGAPTRYEESEFDNQLEGDFLNFIKERFDHIIALSHGKPPSFLLISVALTTSACSEHHNVQYISTESAQTTWEEENCGTKNMQNWCLRYPGRQITLMVGNEETPTSTMAEFRCHPLHAIRPFKNETHWIQLVFPCASIIFILAVIYNFRKLCKEQASKGKLTQAMQNVFESSMDTVNLDSSCKEKSRKELARFDDDSDPSLGTLFTI